MSCAWKQQKPQGARTGALRRAVGRCRRGATDVIYAKSMCVGSAIAMDPGRNTDTQEIALDRDTVFCAIE